MRLQNRNSIRSNSNRTRTQGSNFQNMRNGSRGRNVRVVQRGLQAMGANIREDGVFGPKTEAAVRDFQRRAGIQVDGVVGPQTLQAMVNNMPNGAGNGDSRRGGAVDRNGRVVDHSGTLNGTNRPENRVANGAPPNKTARFESTRFAGQRRQMKEGSITINGNTYKFRSGGGGRGNLPPGDYQITPHMWSRKDRTMQVGGVGYSFAMSNKYDSRVKGTRTLLRIHPDGGGQGTIGCIGIVGNASVQRQFREDMRAELARNGGRFTLKVG